MDKIPLSAESHLLRHNNLIIITISDTWRLYHVSPPQLAPQLAGKITFLEPAQRGVGAKTRPL